MNNPVTIQAVMGVIMASHLTIAGAAEEDRHEDMAQEQDHSGMDHSGMDHSGMDHSGMDHSGMDHSGMDHSGMDHSGMDHSAGTDSEPQQDQDLPPIKARHNSHSAPKHVNHGVSGTAATPIRNRASRLPADAPPPAAAFSGPRHAADAIWGAQEMAGARAVLLHDAGSQHFSQVLFDRFEWQNADAGSTYVLDARGWYGGDHERLWLKLEAESLSDELEELSLQALWSRAFSPYFDWQLGVRYDIEPDGMAYLAAGLQGLAPYWFEIDWGVFLSEAGDLSTEFEAEYDQYLTQRLILQPNLQLALNSEDDGEAQQTAALGLRLRYEIKRELAPYVGFEYSSDLENGDGETRALAGVRFWF